MICYVFSGQGSQKPGMGADLCRQSAAAQAVYRSAKEVLGYDPRALDEADLRQTVYAQPAIVTFSLALWAAFGELLPGPPDLEKSCFGGFSLGEYTALAAAGVLDNENILLLVKERARLMQEAAALNPGAMAAVIGLDENQIDKIIRNNNLNDRVYAVNFNAPDQIVISGEQTGLNTCADLCRAAGARRVIPLPVNGAFHTRFMNDAAKQLADYLKRFSFCSSAAKIYSNTTAQLLPANPDWPAYLAGHLCAPVRWTEQITNMAAAGADHFLEIGPDKTLSSLISRILPRPTVKSSGDLASLEETINTWRDVF